MRCCDGVGKIHDQSRIQCAGLREMIQRLDAECGRIEMAFPYFINKAAPVSGVQSLMDYDVTFGAD